MFKTDEQKTFYRKAVQVQAYIQEVFAYYFDEVSIIVKWNDKETHNTGRISIFFSVKNKLVLGIEIKSLITRLNDEKFTSYIDNLRQNTHKTIKAYLSVQEIIEEHY